MQVARTDGRFPQTVARPSPLGTHTVREHTYTYLYILTLSSGVITYVSFLWHLQVYICFSISIISIHLELGAIQVAHGNLDPGSLVALGSQREVLVTLVAVACWISWLGTLLSHMGVSIDGGYGLFFKGKIQFFNG